jgi:nucleotide-binding universal stress UspA family protein
MPSGLAEGTRAHLSMLCVANTVHPASDILDLARNRSMDLIVIGNHDRGIGMIGYLGSTSAQVVRGTACGVITMPCSARRGAGALLPSPAA